ncbi:hypothetical protein GGX14DRAFT_409250 [Mycena pura]|uniref:Uncharacterized protein n=1 Tax=Mycena pura TaxID=153505 RepID=A0AAD6XYP2_9AGAR|nr:hypothetical protein GGX14DRAFT_409250 [Mycena pura]
MFSFPKTLVITHLILLQSLQERYDEETSRGMRRPGGRMSPAARRVSFPSIKFNRITGSPERLGYRDRLETSNGRETVAAAVPGVTAVYITILMPNSDVYRSRGAMGTCHPHPRSAPQPPDRDRRRTLEHRRPRPPATPPPLQPGGDQSRSSGPLRPRTAPPKGDVYGMQQPVVSSSLAWLVPRRVEDITAYTTATPAAARAAVLGAVGGIAFSVWDHGLQVSGLRMTARPSPDTSGTVLAAVGYEGFGGINSIVPIGTAAAGDVTTYELIRTTDQFETDAETATMAESSGGYSLKWEPLLGPSSQDGGAFEFKCNFIGGGLASCGQAPGGTFAPATDSVETLTTFGAVSLSTFGADPPTSTSPPSASAPSAGPGTGPAVVPSSTVASVAAPASTSDRPNAGDVLYGNGFGVSALVLSVVAALSYSHYISLRAMADDSEVQPPAVIDTARHQKSKGCRDDGTGAARGAENTTNSQNLADQSLSSLSNSRCGLALPLPANFDYDASITVTRAYAYEAAVKLSSSTAGLVVSTLARLSGLFSKTRNGRRSFLVSSRDLCDAVGPLPGFLIEYIAEQRLIAAETEAIALQHFLHIPSAPGEPVSTRTSIVPALLDLSCNVAGNLIFPPTTPVKLPCPLCAEYSARHHITVPLLAVNKPI